MMSIILGSIISNYITVFSEICSCFLEMLSKIIHLWIIHIYPYIGISHLGWYAIKHKETYIHIYIYIYI